MMTIKELNKQSLINFADNHINKRFEDNVDQVITTQVKDEAINISSIFIEDSSLTLSTTNETEIGTITLVTDGGVTEVFGKVNLDNATPAVIIRIRKDSITGTQLDQSTFSEGVNQNITVVGLDTDPPTGNKTYKLTATKSSGGNRSVSFRRLLAGSRKK